MTATVYNGPICWAAGLPDFRAEPLKGGGVRIITPRRLCTPNEWNGYHWRKKSRITADWELSILTALRTSKQGCPKHSYRMRVTVERGAPSRRNFIRDDDNLRFCVKPLHDALKRLGLIVNDDRKWIDAPTPAQFVTPDKRYWAIVTLERLEQLEAPRPQGSKMPKVRA